MSLSERGQIGLLSIFAFRKIDPASQEKRKASWVRIIFYILSFPSLKKEKITPYKRTLEKWVCEQDGSFFLLVKYVSSCDFYMFYKMFSKTSLFSVYVSGLGIVAVSSLPHKSSLPGSFQFSSGSGLVLFGSHSWVCFSKREVSSLCWKYQNS